MSVAPLEWSSLMHRSGQGIFGSSLFLPQEYPAGLGWGAWERSGATLISPARKQGSHSRAPNLPITAISSMFLNLFIYRLFTLRKVYRDSERFQD